MRVQSDITKEFDEDALEKHRKQDINLVESFLKTHEILGSFFTKNWQKIAQFIRVEEYHKDVMFVKHEEISRKVMILLEGNVSAFILTNQSAKPHYIYDFPEKYILSELNGLLGDRHHFGLMAMSDCKIITFDLDYIEHESEDSLLFNNFIDSVFSTSGKLTTDLCNIALEKKLDLRDMLRKHNFFSDIDSLSDIELYRIADKMNYVFLPRNTVLIDNNNTDTIYLIEGGTVIQTKTVVHSENKDDYIYSRSLQSVYINDQADNLQEIFIKQMAKDKSLDSMDDFDKSLLQYNPLYSQGADTIEGDCEQLEVTEDIYRYGVVGEDCLARNKDVDVSAITRTHCCLIELKTKHILPKRSLFEQVVGFFNNKNNDLQYKVIEKQNNDVDVKNKYIALVNFSFMFMVIMSVIGISSRFHAVMSLSSPQALLHHVLVVALGTTLLIKLLKPFNLEMSDLGLTTRNFKRGLLQVIIAVFSSIFIATVIKDFVILMHAHQYGYRLFQPDLIVNDRLPLYGYLGFLILYVVYIFIYELCARGILQNVFTVILEKSKYQYWGSIFAASAIASQFHMSLFHEFSLSLFLGNIFSGVIFANTRNLWAAFIFHSIYSLYLLTVLGLLPSSHY